ncbi:methyl-accepting chemotaxis protein [Pelosinus sp. sgz500959]|uniref:methyl-accepting chemotaxis protein n=1 Tax=Pelosinus sp. sgz500959 TaxID=3242472 RepID=UPI00366F0B07
MLKNAKVGSKILVGFGIILIMMLITTIAAFYNLRIMENATNKVANDSLPLARMVEEIGTELSNEEAGVRGYIASNGDERFLESYAASRKNIDHIMKELEGYYSVYPALESIVENETKPNIEVINKHFDSQIDLIKNGKLQLAQARLADGKIYMDACGHVHKKLRKEISELTNREWMSSKSAGLSAKWSMGIIFLISIMTSGMIAWLLSRMIVTRLHQCVVCLQKVAHGDLSVAPIKIGDKDEIGELGIATNTMLESLKNIVSVVSDTALQVTSSSEDLSNSAEQSALAANQVTVTITEVAQGVENQSKASDEACDVVEQITISVQKVAVNASRVANVADKTSQVAQDGSHAIGTAVNQMILVNQSSQIVSEAVTKLSNSSLEIGQIVDDIANIAGQTNLLALNAAIEAAHAGEQGRGFAVVAEEVRKLAEESQGATKRIAGIIGIIQDDMKAAVLAMNHGAQEIAIGTQVVTMAGQSFNEIQEKVNEVSSQVNGISATLQQLVVGSQRVISSVQTIDTITKETANQTHTVSAATQEQLASIEEIASSSQNLAHLSNKLKDAVNQFIV